MKDSKPIDKDRVKAVADIHIFIGVLFNRIHSLHNAIDGGDAIEMEELMDVGALVVTKLCTVLFDEGMTDELLKLFEKQITDCHKDLVLPSQKEIDDEIDRMMAQS